MKSFLHCIVTGGEKWIHYIRIRENHGDLAMLQHRQPSRIFMEKNSCCVFIYMVRSAWCRILWVAQTERDHYWGSLSNIIDEIEPSIQGKTRLGTTTPGMTKLFSCMIMLDHLLRRQNLLRNTQMRSSTPPAIFFRHCSFRLPVVPIDDAWPVWAYFISYEEPKIVLMDSLKR